MLAGYRSATTVIENVPNAHLMGTASFENNEPLYIDTYEPNVDNTTLNNREQKFFQN